MLRRRNNSSPPDPSLPLRVSPAGSRFAHARISAQVRLLAEDFAFNFPLCSDAATTAHRQTLRSRSGFRLRAPASLTPAFRLKLDSSRRTSYLKFPPRAQTP